MPYCFGIKNIELAVAQLATYDDKGPFYIYPLREGSDDCESSFSFQGGFFCWAMLCSQDALLVPRLCTVWTGTADRDVLSHFRTKGN